MPIEPDGSTWDYWWEFNKNPILRLRDARAAMAPQTGSDDFYLGATRRAEARDALRPSEEQVFGVVLPALKRALDASSHRDVVTACLIAMAKIGRDHEDFTLFDSFAPRLVDSEQEVRETAALAFGIAGIADERTVALLEGLVLDDATGRAARGTSVEVRVRAFAAYGLGLLARRADEATKGRALAALRTLVDDRSLRDRNLLVAAITGIGLLAPDGSSRYSRELCDAAVRTLEAFYLEDRGAGHQLIQAHCPVAIARLLGRDHPRSQHWKEVFVQHLGDPARTRPAGHLIAQSCALALGLLAGPHDSADSADAACSRALLRASQEHIDQTTRHFALVALGRIGGAENRRALLLDFGRASKAVRRPWCALALGIQTFFDRERRGVEEIDQLVVDTLQDELLRAKEPGLTGALGIGLGLCRARDAAPLLRERLLANLPKEQMAGCLGIGLALMDDGESIEHLQKVLRVSERRPHLFVQTAIALGRLGDQRVAEELVGLLQAGEPNLTKLASISSALGFIGDRRSIDPLIGLLDDTTLGALPRAFAAAALGGIADRDALPWNTPIATDVNYRANVETLTDQSAGVLDIL